MIMGFLQCDLIDTLLQCHSSSLHSHETMQRKIELSKSLVSRLRQICCHVEELLQPEMTPDQSCDYTGVKMLLVNGDEIIELTERARINLKKRLPNLPPDMVLKGLERTSLHPALAENSRILSPGIERQTIGYSYASTQAARLPWTIEDDTRTTTLDTIVANEHNITKSNHSHTDETSSTQTASTPSPKRSEGLFHQDPRKLLCSSRKRD